jgi:hypothetical protein
MLVPFTSPFHDWGVQQHEEMVISTAGSFSPSFYLDSE